MIGIYIHVPFCSKKCPYCDFYSCKYNLKAAENYKNAVIRNIYALPKIDVDTVYFGGGTPSIMPPEYISEIIEAVESRLHLCSPEITIEVNPCTMTLKKLKSYKKAGINRLSVGVQSGNDDELEFLGRSHNFEKASEVVVNAGELGFENISCDVMIGVEGQTLDKLERSIRKLTSLPVTHISSYILKIEDNTPFGKTGVSNLLPDDDRIADLYLHSVKLLENAGFLQYEISNFARDGFHSKHNLKYWKCNEYIGIGPSAHSYYNGKRYFVPKNLDEFCEKAEQMKIYEEYKVGTDEEKIMLGLRLTDGICPDDFPKYSHEIIKKSEKYYNYGLAVFENNTLSLTPKGFLVSNSIISDILYGNDV